MNMTGALVVFFVFGLMVGSFLNVVIYRLNVVESIFFGRSKCPKCQSKIKWYDNIPIVSFILLNFRCRNCKEKISWQYPLVEFFTGLLFAFIAYRFFLPENYFSWIVTAYWLFIVSILVVIFVYDVLYLEIPGIVLWIGIGVALLFNLIFDWRDNLFLADILSVRTYSGILGGFFSFLFFFAIAYGSKEKWMGMGDAYLAIFLGLILGAPQVLLALILGFFFGAVVGVGLIAFGEKKMKSKLPLAPFLVIGSLVSLFFYFPITEWYWNLLAF